MNTKWRVQAMVTSPLGILLLAGIFGTCVHLMARWILVSGHYIPSKDLIWDYLVALCWAIAIFLAIEIAPLPAGDRKILVRLWLARCLVTLGFMLFYEKFYDLDAYGYFENSLTRDFDWSQVGFTNGTPNVTAITWTMSHYLPIFGSYHGLKVCFSAVGLIAIYIFYRGTILWTESPNPKFLYLLGLFPSALFWSSILGKDPLELLGIALYVYGAISLQKTGKLGSIIWIFFGIVLAAWIRSWSAVILIPPLLLLGMQGLKGTMKRLIAVSTFGALYFYAVQFFLGRFKITSMDEFLQITNSLSHSWNYGGAGESAPEFHTLSQMFMFAPGGMFTALFRPLPGEVRNLFGLLAGFENLFLVSLLLLAVRRFNFKLFRDPTILAATCLVVLWSFIYSFISYQNLGSAFRFRLQILPVLLSLLLAFKSKTYGENIVAERET